MKRLLALAVALVISTPATASDAEWADGAWNPPARYDHAFTGKLIIRRLPQKQVVKACARMFVKYRIAAKGYPGQRGCAVTLGGNSCLVVMIDRKYKQSTPKAVFRHEVAHCNGWQASHPE